MKPKKPNDLEKGLIMMTTLISTNRNLIDNSSLNAKHKILKEIDVILKINKDSPEQNILFLNKNKTILLTHKDDFLKVEMYENWMKCYLELSLIMKRKCESFLTKNIDSDIVTVNDIINEIIICLTIDIGFFNDCSQLHILLNKNIDHEKYILFNQIQNSLNTVNNFIKSSMLDKHMSICGITQILDFIKINVVDKKFTEKGIFNWNTLSSKIKSYVKNTKPFDILNIRQTDSVKVICDTILNLLKDEKRRIVNKFIERDKIRSIYEKELVKIKQSEKYKKEDKYKHDADSIFMRNIDACIILSNNILSLDLQIDKTSKNVKILKNINNDPQKQLDLLRDINHFIFNSYQMMIYENTNLDIETLQSKEKRFDYINSLLLDSKWNDICLSVRNYLYFKNAKSMHSVQEYEAIKCKLESIIPDKQILKEINGHVKIANEIITRGYMFIKQYILDLYEKRQQIPDITDIDFINMSIRALVINDKRGSNMGANNKELLKKLELFYDTNFKPIYGEDANGIQK